MGIFDSFNSFKRAVKSAAKSTGVSDVIDTVKKPIDELGNKAKDTLKELGKKGIDTVSELGKKAGLKPLADLAGKALNPVIKKGLNISNLLEKKLMAVPYAKNVVNKIKIIPKVGTALEKANLTKKVLKSISKGNWQKVSDQLIEANVDPRNLLPKKIQDGIHIKENKSSIERN